MINTDLTSAIQSIKQALVNMPKSAGVYRMIDKDDNTIYVGKAKDLIKRVTNYTRPERLEYRIQNMIARIARVEVITTNTEVEALLLESNLIKKYEPKYNILLKDDKSYPYILLSGDHEFARVQKHRGKKEIKGDYYGPFASAGAVNKSISDIQKAFLIRPCTDTYFKNRERPCMEYQIKRCSAPCVGKISQEDYAELVKQAKDYLSGKSRQVQESLVELMEQESQNLNFEKAAIYRDRIKALNKIQARQTVSVASLNDADVLGISLSGGICCIQVFFFRGGNNLGNKVFYPKHIEKQSESEVLAAFICQFYQGGNIAPKEIVVGNKIDEKELIEEALSEDTKYKVRIIIPKAGDKKELLDNANKNANSSLNQKILSSNKQKQILEEVAKIFDLKEPPARIEVYDNSHISGTNAIGGMIVAGEEGFNKKAYRRFNIKEKSTVPGDDYAMMREVLTRRFGRLKQGHPDKKSGIWPDLVLIDGGYGHMGVVAETLKKLGLYDDINFVCISKGVDRNAGREQFHMPTKDSFTLPYDSAVMYYLQRLRDEAHRFAIGSHRKKRSSSIKKSQLDDIEGVGTNRKKLLLNHFGSLDDVKQATLKELEAVKGINKSTAKSIYNFFNE